MTESKKNPGYVVKGNRGRPKGALSAKRREIEEMHKASKLGPAEFLFAILNGDWATLGYYYDTKKVVMNGHPVEVECISLDHRMEAAKELMKYLYVQKKTLDVTSSDGTGITVNVIDYNTQALEDKKKDENVIEVDGEHNNRVTT